MPKWTLDLLTWFSSVFVWFCEINFPDSQMWSFCLHLRHETYIRHERCFHIIVINVWFCLLFFLMNWKSLSSMPSMGFIVVYKGELRKKNIGSTDGKIWIKTTHFYSFSENIIRFVDYHIVGTKLILIIIYV